MQPSGRIAQAYKLCWNIDDFFAWWKRHLKVYHLIAQSPYGLMVQILSGLITYLLLALYCHSNYQEKVSIRRVRQLRTQIENELRCWLIALNTKNMEKNKIYKRLMQKPNRKLLNFIEKTIADFFTRTSKIHVIDKNHTY